MSRWLFSTNAKDMVNLYCVFVLIATTTLVLSILLINLGYLPNQVQVDLNVDQRGFFTFVVQYPSIIGFCVITPAIVGLYVNNMLPGIVGKGTLAVPRLNSYSVILLGWSLVTIIFSIFVQQVGQTPFQGQSVVLLMMCNSGITCLVTSIHFSSLAVALICTNILLTILDDKIAIKSTNNQQTYLWTIFIVVTILILLSVPLVATLIVEHLGTLSSLNEESWIYLFYYNPQIWVIIPFLIYFWVLRPKVNNYGIVYASWVVILFSIVLWTISIGLINYITLYCISFCTVHVIIDVAITIDNSWKKNIFFFLFFFIVISVVVVITNTVFASETSEAISQFEQQMRNDNRWKTIATLGTAAGAMGAATSKIVASESTMSVTKKFGLTGAMALLGSGAAIYGLHKTGMDGGIVTDALNHIQTPKANLFRVRPNISTITPSMPSTSKGGGSTHSISLFLVSISSYSWYPYVQRIFILVTQKIIVLFPLYIMIIPIKTIFIDECFNRFNMRDIPIYFKNLPLEINNNIYIYSIGNYIIVIIFIFLSLIIFNTIKDIKDIKCNAGTHKIKNKFIIFIFMICIIFVTITNSTFLNWQFIDIIANIDYHNNKFYYFSIKIVHIVIIHFFIDWIITLITVVILFSLIIFTFKSGTHKFYLFFVDSYQNNATKIEMWLISIVYICYFILVLSYCILIIYCIPVCSILFLPILVASILILVYSLFLIDIY